MTADSSPPEVTRQQAVVALSALYDRHSETGRWIAQYSLIALAHDVREAWPNAATISFEWSDQGNWLSLWEVRDSDGNEIEPGDVDADSYAWNLGEDNQSGWLDLMTTPDDDRAGIRARHFHLDIDKALALQPTESEVTSGG